MQQASWQQLTATDALGQVIDPSTRRLQYRDVKSILNNSEGFKVIRLGCLDDLLKIQANVDEQYLRCIKRKCLLRP